MGMNQLRESISFLKLSHVLFALLKDINMSFFLSFFLLRLCRFSITCLLYFLIVWIDKETNIHKWL